MRRPASAWRLAAIFLLAAVAMSVTPAAAQDAQFICGADEYGRPANCVSTNGAVADPTLQPSYTPPVKAYPPPVKKRTAYKRRHHAQHYAQPYRQHHHPQPYPEPAYYPPVYQPPPQPQTSCCCPVKKRGLFTSLSFSLCGNASAYSPYSQYPAYAPPQYPHYSYYPQYPAYPQYGYYPQANVQLQWTARSHHRSHPRPHSRVFGTW